MMMMMMMMMMIVMMIIDLKYIVVVEAIYLYIAHVERRNHVKSV